MNNHHSQDKCSKRQDDKNVISVGLSVWKFVGVRSATC